jgi:rubrerythrin
MRDPESDIEPAALWMNSALDARNDVDQVHLCPLCGCETSDPLEECPVCAAELDGEGAPDA